MTIVSRFDFSAGRGVPLPHGPVRRGRHQPRAVRAEGGAMRHVKPHGSLFAMCGRREEYARALLGAVASFDKNLIVNVGHGWPRRLAAEYGLTVGTEGYIDLDYQPDGFPFVEPVKQPRDPDDVVRRALSIVRDQSATALDGSAVKIATPTVCLHGDMPNVLEVARRLRKRLRSKAWRRPERHASRSRQWTGAARSHARRLRSRHRAHAAQPCC